ncbi:MAG: SNF2-related protein [Bacteroidota bacterium]|nr:SNF2-related protein [Bacteroidota bacterium]
MSIKYGNTWWGEQWLNSLSYIDYSNRLPRGRRYANNGSVKDIRINGNKIKAKVQGTRLSPYRVTVTVPLFSEKQKKQIMSAVLDNPLILSKLLNRELPGHLNTIALSHKIRIFPDAWKDLDMHCSCPDWAVPCKHLASVIYIIANEIDRNPFIIFSLHGLDILKELTNSGFKPEETTVNIPSPKQRLITEPPLNKSQSSDVDPQQFDFSLIPDLRETLLSLLEDKPLFYKSDFKTRLNTAYKKIGKNAEKQKREIHEDDNEINYEKYTDLEMVINNEVFYFDTILYADDEEKHFSKRQGISKFIEFLDRIPPKIINRLSHPLLSLLLIYKFSLKLLLESAYIPEMLELTGKSYIIRWIPALMNESVKTIFDSLVKLTPPKTVQVIDASFETRYFEPEEQVKVLCSQFIDYYVNACANQFVKPEDPVESFFFTYATQKFSGLGEQEIPQTIHRWISIFYIHHKQYVPVIKVEDEEAVFIVDVLVENRADGLTEPVRLSTFLEDKSFKDVKTGVLKDLTLLTSSFSELEQIISSGGKEILEFDSEGFTDVLLRILPLVKMYGIRVLLPNSLKKLVRPQSSLALFPSQNSQKSKSFLSLSDMLDFNWQIALGHTTMSPDKFLDLVKGMTGIVKIKNQYVIINREEIALIEKNLNSPPVLKSNEVLQIALSEEYNGAKIKISGKAKKLIQSYLTIKKVNLPKGLDASLRPYQLRGYEWMYKNLHIGLGSIIADDMGLGKTVQVIALLLKMKEEGQLQKRKALVVVPTTLLTNWEKEIQKFTNELTTSIYHGPSRVLDKQNADITITTYGIVRSDIDILNKSKWECCIIDESQNIKNPSTRQTRAVKKIKASVRIAMSGTPVENRLSEYWSVFDYTNKGYLGSLKLFSKNYAEPIELERNQEKLDKFKKITAPFIMRRLKTDKKIISDLPDKVENDSYAHLTKEQAAIYKNVVDDMMNSIEQYQGKDSDDQIKRRGMVFKLMTALKQICNHPSQYLKKQQDDPMLSGKTQLLLQLLENIYEANEKVLIFTQFRETGKMLERIINSHFDTPIMFLHGGTSRKKRDEMVVDFQTKTHLKTFILSIKAAGTGLNLTAAGNVIHFDLWWNPAVEQQATDRAYRIGQDKNVMVYRMITKDSFEEKINEMIQSKKELADLTVNTGEKWIGDLTNKELKTLVEI